MSQITSINSGGGGGGDILTITGDTGGPVGPTAGNINILGSNASFIGVFGSPGTSTLTIINTNQLVAGITTVDAAFVPVSAIPISVPNNSGAFVEARFLALTQDRTRIRSGYGSILARKPGAGPTSLNVGDTFSYVGPKIAGFFPQARFALSGNDIVLEVSGILATIIDWTVVLNFFYV